MKLAGYLRVSTDSQAEDGYGLDVQRDAIKRWAKKNGHTIERWCSDEGVSGAIEALDRDGLSCVLSAIESGKAGGLIIARLDRLARSLTVQEAALAHIWRAGGSVFAVDTGEVHRDDPDDPMRKAMRQMIGVFSELERAMITKRMRDGRKHKADAGGYAGGRPALGYRERCSVPRPDKCL
jgi:DNA invertase Pin-like site-specific DNA recombinase